MFLPTILATLISASAYLSSSLTNSSGDGTLVYVPFDTVVFDYGSNFNTSNGTWTAPGDGIILVNGAVEVSNLSSNHNSLAYLIYNQTTGEQRYCTCINPYPVKNTVPPNGYYMDSFSETMSCSTGDVFQIIVFIQGGTKTATINGGSRETRFNITFLQ